MQTIAVHSEAGGQGKTTTSVSLATLAAREGLNTLLIDLDPRAAATKWVDVEPTEEGLHTGAILADEDPEGWASQMAVPTTFSPNLRMIPAGRALSNREKDSTDGIELRLKRSLIGLDADLVVIDCPNRQGGPLTLSALHAADGIIYAAGPTQDGVDGVIGSRKSVTTFRRNMETLGADPNLTELGIVLGNVAETIMSRVARNSIEELSETNMLLHPIVPARAIVQESRTIGHWYGDYRKGEPVVTAYSQILKEVLR